MQKPIPPSTALIQSKPSFFSSMKARIINKYYMIKPKILSKLPFKSATQSPVMNAQPTIGQKAKLAPAKAKININAAKNRLANGLSLTKPKLATQSQSVPVSNSPLLNSNNAPIAKQSIFQKAKLGILKAKSAVFNKPALLTKTPQTTSV